MEFFERRIRPLLAQNCYSCHGGDKQFGSLRLDSHARVLKGGKSGPGVVPGKPEESLLIKAVRHETLQMPLGRNKLKGEQIADLEEWVRAGAPWPQEAPAKLSTGHPDFYKKLTQEHWAFQPVRKPELPNVSRVSWARTPIDRFILASLEKAGLAPARPADKQTLIRRLSFVLTGLPPTVKDIESFVQDRSADAYERLVDRLMASPHFGEQWARHWLDLMRFGETHGYEWNYEIIGPWRYRDYLIRAFNSDVPYDQLVREHIAGDLLEKPRINLQERINESVIGTTSFRLGEAGHDDCIEFRSIGLDVVDSQIDTVTKAFQGLTVTCARCHDHKLDPIPTEDYYALSGVVTSARQLTHTIDTADVNAEYEKQLRQLKAEIRSQLAMHWIKETEDIGRYLLAAGTVTTENKVLDGQKLKHWRALLKKEKFEFEDPFTPWLTLAREENQKSGGWAAAWRELADLYRTESQARVAFNRYHFESFGDFRTGGVGGWYADGLGLRDGTTPSGEFAVAAEGDKAVSGIFPAGIYTHVLSEKLNGALRSPFLPQNKKFISLQVMGGKLSARRMIIDNCYLGENFKVLDQDSLSWQRLQRAPTQELVSSLSASQKRLPAYVELVTKFDNPRIPDRPKALKDVTPEQLESQRSYFGVTRAVLHNADEIPKDELTHMTRLFQQSELASMAVLAEHYMAACRQAIRAWSEGRSTDDDVRWLDWLIRNNLITNHRDLSPQLRELIEAYRKIEERISPPRIIDGMADLGEGFDVSVLPYGDWKTPGKPAPRGYLQLLTPAQKRLRLEGSGRRELAEIIASADNPLTARVMVNRLWHHVFGRGLVSTVDNFGSLAERPSHPELLDYLAGQFVENRWSIKKMIRLLVVSQTFRQSNQVTPKAGEVDPRNRLLHHYPVRRLEAESIRDAILATSGVLNRTLYGPSIHPYREEAKDYRKLLKGPLDGNGRRSIYLKVTRMEGPKFLELFDFPNTMVTLGSRDVTNVPSQALAMLNDPFVVDQARVWAERMVSRGGDSVERQIDAMFWTALGRPPQTEERERFRGLVIQLTNLHGISPSDALRSAVVWKDVAHALFNLKEFIYFH